MSHKFSQQLRGDCINHFRLKYDQDISHAQADEFLNSLADFVETMTLPAFRRQVECSTSKVVSSKASN
ncbi:hypothetical protein ISS03_04205 [Patescibacteria group bacterium]|nr:hypothetical protein [Patescibacteria group bacterium]